MSVALVILTRWRFGCCCCLWRRPKFIYMNISDRKWCNTVNINKPQTSHHPFVCEYSETKFIANSCSSLLLQKQCCANSRWWSRFASNVLAYTEMARTQRIVDSNVDLQSICVAVEVGWCAVAYYRTYLHRTHFRIVSHLILFYSNFVFSSLS